MHLILHVHKSITDSLDIIQVANSLLVETDEHREHVFDTQFTSQDLV